MRVYIAAHYSKKDEVTKAAHDLEKLGITVVSSWHKEDYKPSTKLPEVTRQSLQRMAIRDRREIECATHLLLFSIGPLIPFTRGGHCYENGYADALGLKTMIVGERQMVFHYYPNYKICKTWDSAKRCLKKELRNEYDSITYTDSDPHTARLRAATTRIR